MKLPKQATGTWKFWYIVAVLIKPFLLRLHLEGVENVPLEGGCILASNHTIGPDYVIVGYASPRQVYYMAKVELFQVHPCVSWLATSSGAFPVHRGQHDGDAIEQAVKIVRSGRMLGMFPEGHRSRTGALQRGKTGVARIALQAQAPIVPVVVINAEPVLRDWLKLKRRPLVTVRFGPPIAATGVPSDPQAVQRLTTDMMLSPGRTAAARAAGILCRRGGRATRRSGDSPLTRVTHRRHRRAFHKR